MTAIATDNIYDLNAQDLIRACDESLNLFSQVALPQVCEDDWPDFYETLWHETIYTLQQERVFGKYAVGFPRGHAKTTYLKLLVAYVILRVKSINFILIVCANENRAKDFIRDVIAILDSENIRKLYGNWRANVSTDKAEQKVFRFLDRTICLAGGGPGTSLRGFNVGHARPDMILLDDAQTKECAESKIESLNFIKWFVSTLMKLKNPKRCTYIYVGNMYPDLKIEENLYACMLRNLQKNTQWKSFIVGAILSDGRALWEAVQPLKQLLAEFIADNELGQGDTFASEVLNDPTRKPAAGFNPSKIKLITPEPFELHQGSCIIIDPSGYKTGSNKTAIGYAELWDGVPALMEVSAEVRTPLECIHFSLQLAIKKGCTLIVCEDVAYQATLLFWFEMVAQQLGVNTVFFMPITPGGSSKNSRILVSIEKLMAGELALSPATYSPYCQQALVFRPSTKNNTDDILDIVAYMERVFQQYSNLMAIAGTSSTLMSVERMQSISADDAQAPF